MQGRKIQEGGGIEKTSRFPTHGKGVFNSRAHEVTKRNEGLMEEKEGAYRLKFIAPEKRRKTGS